MTDLRFIHRFIPATHQGLPPLLLLHGTGGDLQGTGHVDVLTNGWIGQVTTVATDPTEFAEKTGDLRVGLIASNSGDVLINVPGGNIYDASTTGTPPSARIKIDVDGALTELRTTLDGDAGVTLPGVSVFDSACAELYVSAQNAVQFIPAELRLLARLATLQDRMRHDIAGERQSLQGVEPSRDGYPLTTEVGRALARLRGAGDDPDLASLVVMTAEQEARFAELCGIIAAAAGSGCSSTPGGAAIAAPEAAASSASKFRT